MGRLIPPCAKAAPGLRLRVAGVFEAFARLELGLGAGADRHRFTRAGVATGGSLALGDRKGPKANEAHFITRFERGSDGVKYGFDHLTGIIAVGASRIRD